MRSLHYLGGGYFDVPPFRDISVPYSNFVCVKKSEGTTLGSQLWCGDFTLPPLPLAGARARVGAYAYVRAGMGACVCVRVGIRAIV